MKLYLKIALGLALPVFALAADNVTLSTDVIISLSGSNLTVTGGNTVLDTIVVDSSSFDAFLSPGQTIKINSSASRKLNVTIVGSMTAGGSCTASGNLYTITNPSVGFGATTTVSMTSDTCSIEGGGGGGTSGGSGIAPTIPAQEANPPTITTEQAQAAAAAIIGKPPTGPVIPKQSVSGSFSRGLALGTANSDVKRLQILLNADPDTRIAASGVGSSGSETNYFGSMTTKAVQKFQVKHGVAKAGDVGYGNVGPKTRAKLLEVFGDGLPVSTTPAPAVAPIAPASPSAAQLQQAQDLQNQVNALLQQLSTIQNKPVAPQTAQPFSDGGIPAWMRLVPAPQPY